jgi:hypothetical protein
MSSQDHEEEKNDRGPIIKGILNVKGKNQINDLSSNKTWTEIGVPEWLKNNLTTSSLAYANPSFI